MNESFVDQIHTGIHLVAKNKNEALSAMAAHLLSPLKYSKEEINECHKALVDREHFASTAVGRGIAFPHAKSDVLKSPVFGLFTLRDPVDFDSLDGDKVYMAAMILAPVNVDRRVTLQNLARFARLLKEEGTRKALRCAETPEEFRKVLRSAAN